MFLLCKNHTIEKLNHKNCVTDVIPLDRHASGFDVLVPNAFPGNGAAAQALAVLGVESAKCSDAIGEYYWWQSGNIICTPGVIITYAVDDLEQMAHIMDISHTTNIRVTLGTKLTVTQLAGSIANLVNSLLVTPIYLGMKEKKSRAIMEVATAESLQKQREPRSQEMYGCIVKEMATHMAWVGNGDEDSRAHLADLSKIFRKQALEFSSTASIACLGEEVSGDRVNDWRKAINDYYTKSGEYHELFHKNLVKNGDLWQTNLALWCTSQQFGWTPEPVKKLRLSTG